VRFTATRHKHHGAVRLHKSRIVDVMPFLFFINHGLDKGLQIFVEAPSRNTPAIVIVLAEKARRSFPSAVSRMREQCHRTAASPAQSAQSLPARHPQNDTFGPSRFSHAESVPAATRIDRSNTSAAATTFSRDQ